ETDKARTAHVLALVDAPGRGAVLQDLPAGEIAPEGHRRAARRRVLGKMRLRREHPHMKLAAAPPIRRGENVEARRLALAKMPVPDGEVDAAAGQRRAVAHGNDGEGHAGGEAARR